MKRTLLSALVVSSLLMAGCQYNVRTYENGRLVKVEQKTLFGKTPQAQSAPQQRATAAVPTPKPKPTAASYGLPADADLSRMSEQRQMMQYGQYFTKSGQLKMLPAYGVSNTRSTYSGGESNRSNVQRTSVQGNTDGAVTVPVH